MIVATVAHAGVRIAAVKSEAGGCAWWNIACQGGQQVANSGLAAITRSIASGASVLLGEIVKTIDESTQVPLADPTYQKVYFGFLGLAAPIVGIVLLSALTIASIRRDAGTVARAVVGVGVAAIGGALYIVFAQGLVAIDNALAHGIVEVTGYNLEESITELAMGFDKVAGMGGEMAANMLIILLMLIMLVAGLVLWFVLVLRKVAILVVVAFAPLLIAGYLWAPTRSWVRKLTEVLIALVFTKSAIYALFGVGLALLSRGTEQSISDFVGTTVLMCGACFAPLLMLRLVHFAADTHLAGEAMGTLRGGIRPVTNRLPTPTFGRSDMAGHQGQAPGRDMPSPEPSRAVTLTPEAASTSSTSASGAASTGTAAAATAGTLLVAKEVASTAHAAQTSVASSGAELAGNSGPARAPSQREPDPADRIARGPSDHHHGSQE